MEGSIDVRPCWLTGVRLKVRMQLSDLMVSPMISAGAGDPSYVGAGNIQRYQAASQ
jgi:hypothetical protein